MNKIKEDNLRIVQISDTQLGFTDSRNRSRAAEQHGIPEEDLERQYSNIDKEYYELAIEKIKELTPAPEAIFNTGDLVDSPNNQQQWQDYLKITKSFMLPVYELMGNHDGFTEQGLDYFRNTLKKKDFYSFEISDVYFLVLNSNFLKGFDKFPDEAELHQAYVEKELRENSSAKNKIILMHHPLFFEHPDEEEQYFSLPPVQRQWVLDLIEKYKVMAVLSGHYHRNHIIKYKHAELITSGPVSEAMGFDNDGQEASRGFRVLDLNLDTGEIDHTYIRLRSKPS